MSSYRKTQEKTTKFYNLDVIISHQLALTKATEEYSSYKDKEREIQVLKSIKELDDDIKSLENKNKE